MFRKCCMYKMNIDFISSLENDVLISSFSIMEKHDSLKNVLSSIKVIFKLFFRKVKLELDSKEQSICFFITSTSNRGDHNFSYNKVVNVYKDKSVLTLKEGATCNLIRIIKIIIFTRKVIIQEKEFSFGKKLLLIRSKIIANDLLCCFKKNNFNNIKLAVVYSDRHLNEYIFITYMKTLDIKTATLQHGAFISKREVSKPTIDFAGIEFAYSRADYFLAWNQFTKDEAIKSGMDSDKIKILGIPKYINYNFNSIAKENKNVFGLMLNGASMDQLNRELISYANELAKKTNKKYYLKYHPGFKNFVYDDIVEKEYFAGNLEINSTITDYIDMVDFTLISNSSVFIELVFLHHKVYRMNAGEYDKFSDIKINSFNNTEELMELVENDKENRNNEMFKYLCYTENPKKTYKEFFNKFIQ